MLRRTDRFALLGLLLLLIGFVLYLRGSAEHISLLYWLGGPVLWFAGFAILIGGLAAHLLSGTRDKTPSSPTKREPDFNPATSRLKQRREPQK